MCFEEPRVVRDALEPTTGCPALVRKVVQCEDSGYRWLEQTQCERCVPVIAVHNVGFGGGRQRRDCCGECEETLIVVRPRRSIGVNVWVGTCNPWHANKRDGPSLRMRSVSCRRRTRPTGNVERCLNLAIKRGIEVVGNHDVHFNARGPELTNKT